MKGPLQSARERRHETSTRVSGRRFATGATRAVVLERDGAGSETRTRTRRVLARAAMTRFRVLPERDRSSSFFAKSVRLFAGFSQTVFRDSMRLRECGETSELQTPGALRPAWEPEKRSIHVALDATGNDDSFFLD